jgi:signal peptidase II
VQRETGTRRGPRAITLMFVSLVALTAIDLGTKEWALDNLSAPRAAEHRPAVCEPEGYGAASYQRKPGPSRALFPGILNLYYAENCGAAFSMLRTAPTWLRLSVFGAASLGATIVLITMFVRGSGSTLFAAAVPLIVSGAIGNNLSDRPRHGFVVDFLQVDPDLFNYPIFNVADIWIAIGFGLLVIDGFRNPRKTLVDPALVVHTNAR